MILNPSSIRKTSGIELPFAYQHLVHVACLAPMYLYTKCTSEASKTKCWLIGVNLPVTPFITSCAVMLRRGRDAFRGLVITHTHTHT